MFDPELLREFVAEAQEQLEIAEREILACEQGQASAEHINRLFRSLHTIKGGASLLRAGAMTRLAHALENVVGRVRAAQLTASAEVTEALLGGLDRLRVLLVQVVAAGATLPAADELPIDREVSALEHFLIDRPAPSATGGPPPASPRARRPAAGQEPLLAVFLAEAAGHLEVIDAALVAWQHGRGSEERPRLLRALHRIEGAAAFLELTSLRALSAALEATVEGLPAEAPLGVHGGLLLRAAERLRALVGAQPGDEAAVDDLLAELGRPRDDAAAPQGKLAGAARPPTKATIPTTETAKQDSVRIAVPLLDKLMNLAAELVLVRNQNVQAAVDRDIEQLLTVAQRLNVVTSELQATVMRTRMRAIGGVFNKFHRTTRDMGRALGKEVDLEVHGGEVELDKGIIDAISDPLTHLVRNAVAHGIEAPAARQARGKARAGRVVLSAFQRHGLVHITVEDDGAGMEGKALVAAALRKGLLSDEQAGRLSEREALELAFLPGLTTAVDVTDIAGRGVGMDVVRQGLQRVGGAVEIASRPREGTRVTIKLPLTLAIVPALIVAVNDAHFAVPQQNIDEVVWLHGAEVYQQLKLVDGQEVYSLRGKLLPVLRLGRLLDIAPVYVDPLAGRPQPDARAQRPDRRAGEDPEDGLTEDGLPTERRRSRRERRVSLDNSVYLVVLRVGEQHFGLLVDRVVDTEEIVVKSLHEQLKGCRAYSGTTVLGDGQIAMILDVAVLAQLGGLRLDETSAPPAVVRSSGADRQTVLLFDLGAEEAFAVPLRSVSRVEQVATGRIRHSSGREYLDFRGGVIALLRLEALLESTKACYAPDHCFVIIPKATTRAERPVGIVAACIRDTVRVGGTIDHSLSQPGVVGSALVEDRLTLFLDLYQLLERAQVGRRPTGGRRLLLAEDSAFYAALLVPHLRSAGLEVKLVSNGRAALAALIAEPFDLLVSDLEMPEMGGLELATAIRRQPELHDLRLLAISSLNEPAIEERAQAAGFDAFVSKLDQDRLLERVLRWLN